MVRCSPRCRLAAILAIALLPWSAPALGPHEIAVLVNDASPRSLEVANHYIHLRRIPPENVIHLTLPPSSLASDPTLTRDDFTRLIWEPATRALRERRLEDHILAWAYSADFPVRITGDPELSLHGLTYVRNQPPPAEDIRRGRWASPLFAGPGEGSPRKGPSRSLEQYAAYLQTNMPLPNILIGHTGSRGQTTTGVVASLQAARRAEGGPPASAEVLFLAGDDVRARARAWQFADAAAEVQALGVKATVAAEAPSPPRRLMGLMMGAARPDPAACGILMPGSLADHLTSYAAAFVRGDQGMLTAWLRAGAAASAGTVTEPYAIWSKFPHARVFAHYAAGCSALEAYTQSIACPLQIQLVGDPLASPWAKPPGVTLVDLGEPDKPVTGTASFLASTWASPFESPPHTLFLLDGRSVNLASSQPQVTLDTSQLSDGYHALRVVAYTHGTVRHQGFDERGFVVRNAERSVTLNGLAEGDRIDLDHLRRVAVEAEGSPASVSLVSQSREIARVAWKNGASLEFDPRRLGAGPQSIQAVAHYEDGQQVAGVPLRFVVERLNQPPALAGVDRDEPAPGVTRLIARARDPEGDPATATWAQDLFAPGAGWSVNDLAAAPAGPEATIRATGSIGVAVAEATRDCALAEIAVDVAVPQADAARATQAAGLVFDYRDTANFSFFAWLGGESGWVLGAYEGGRLRSDGSCGAFLAPDAWHRIAVRRASADAVEAIVDGEVILRRARSAPLTAVGLMTGSDAARFRAPAVSPPCGDAKVLIRTQGEMVEFRGRQPLGWLLWLSDGTALRQVPAPAAGPDQ